MVLMQQKFVTTRPIVEYARLVRETLLLRAFPHRPGYRNALARSYLARAEYLDSRSLDKHGRFRNPSRLFEKALMQATDLALIDQIGHRKDSYDKIADAYNRLHSHKLAKV